MLSKSIILLVDGMNHIYSKPRFHVHLLSNANRLQAFPVSYTMEEAQKS